MSEHLSGLNLVELYDELIFPDEPASVSMWPETVGWLWMAEGLLVVALIVIWRVRVWRRATAYRRAAMAALEAAGDDPAEIAGVLRRTALAAFPREAVTGLSGDAWLAFLDEAAPECGFAGHEAGTVLARAPYAPVTPHPDLAEKAALWVARHRVPA